MLKRDIVKATAGIVIGILMFMVYRNYTLAEETHADSRANSVTTITTVDYRYNSQAPVGYFEVNGVDGKNHVAFCGWHEKKLPELGWQLSTIDVFTLGNRKNEDLRKVLWYGFGGPADIGATYAETALGASVALGHMDTDDTGETEGPIGKTFLAKVKKMEAPPEEFTVYCARNLQETDYLYQCLVYSIYNPSGELKIIKKTADTNIVKQNENYSLEGAVYTVYSDSKCSQKVAELTTTSNGESGKIELKAGTYYLKETAAPKGYKLDNKVHKVIISGEETTVFYAADEPLTTSVDLLLSKYDNDKEYSEKGNSSQGAATLKGAEYSVEFYGGMYETVKETEQIEPLRTWIFKTDEEGRIRFEESCFVSGDDLWKDSNGKPILPLGTVKIQEVKPPEGYNISKQVFVRTLKVNEELQTVKNFHTIAAPEEIVRGNVKIVKFGRGENAESSLMTPLEGIDFVFTSKTDGTRFKVTTDKNGDASTEVIGGLPYDTYIVAEENTPSNYGKCEAFEVVIDEQGELLSYIIENKKSTAAITVVKKDAETNQIIAKSGTEFRILDENKNPITVRMHYPMNENIEIFRTDETGTFTLPEKLPCGTYYLEEVRAPEGYLKGELLEFTVKDNYKWEEPFTIECFNENVMGQITFVKVNGTTSEALAGAEFEIYAAEDIVTPDGTIRAVKGELVDKIVSDKEGKVLSKELYLGEYIVKEIKAPDSYVLLEEEYKVTLAYKDQETALVVRDMGIVENIPVTIKEEPEPVEPKEEVQKETEQTDEVKTGDNTNVSIYVSTGFAAIALFLVSLKIKKTAS